MKRAPHIENHNLSRTLHRLRSRSPTQIQGTTERKSLDATQHNANRPKDRKTHAEFAPKSSENSARAGRAKAIFLVKSP